MRRLRFWINALLFLVPICVLSVGAYRFVRRVFGYLNTDARLAGTASAEATRALGRRVVIGDVKLSANPFGLFGASRIVLKNIFVANSATDDTTAFVQAGSVTIAYNLRQVLLGNLKTPLVDEIRIVRPEAMLTRNLSGLWNFTQLIKPRKSGGRPFVDRIAFLDGTVLYNDLAFPHPPKVASRPLRTRFDHLTGIVLIRPDKTAAFDVAGIATPDIVKEFHLTGVFDPATLRSTIHIAANQLSLPFVSARFLPPNVGRITSGAANLDLTALYTPVNATPPNTLDPNALDAHGSVTFSNVTAAIPQASAPLEGLTGAVSLVGQSALTDLSGRFGGAAFRLSGSAFNLIHKVRHDNRTVWEIAKPTLAMKGAVQHADFLRLARLVHYEKYLPNLPAQVTLALANSRAAGDVDFQFVGPLDDPTATLSTRIATLQYDTLQAKSVNIQLLYAHRIVDSDIRGIFTGGDVVLRARTLLGRPGTFQVEGHGKNLHLAQAGFSPKAKVTGTARIDFTMRGQSGQTPNITAQAEVLDAGVNGQTLHSLYARAETVGRKLVLRTVRAEDTKGFALAGGTIDLKTQELNLNVEADELDIGAFVQAFPIPTALAFGSHTPAPSTKPEPEPLAIDGIGYLRASVQGTLKAPEVSGKLSAFALQTDKKDANSLLANKAEVSFTVNRKALHIAQGTVERYPGLVSFFGDVNGLFDGKPTLHLTVRTDDKNRLSVSDLLQIAKIETPGFLLTGTLLTTDLVVEGTPGDPRIDTPFTARIEDAAINGARVTNAFVTATFDGTNLHLLKLGADLAQGSVAASGMVSKDGKLDLDVSGSHIVLDLLKQMLPDVPLDNVTGTANVKAHITGTTTQPAAVASLVEVQGLAYNGYDAGDISGSARYADKTVFAQNFTLTDATTHKAVLTAPDLTYNLDSQGIQTDKPIRLDAMPISRVRDLIRSLPAPQNKPGSTLAGSFGQTELGRIATEYMSKLEGALSGTLSVAGTLADPRADVKINSSDIRLNDYLITELTAQATVTNTTATGTGGRIVLRPLLPPPGSNPDNPDATIALGRFSVGYKGDIDADITAYNLDANLLKGFLPPNQRIDVSGTVDYLNIVASGKTASPNLAMSLNLKNIGYRGQTLDRVDIARVDIRGSTLEDGKVIEAGYIRASDIQVEKRDRSTGEIRKYTAHAGGSISGFQWQSPFIPDDAKLDLTASFSPQDAADNNLRVVSLFAPGLLPPTVVGTLTLNAAVQGTRAAPRLTGGLTVTAPKFQFGKFTTGLQDLRAVLTFHDDRVEVTEFSGHTQIYDAVGTPVKKGGGGSNITLAGGLPLGVDGAQDPVGLHLGVDQAVFEETALPGLKGAKARGMARIDLNLTGSLLDPTLGGTISVHDTQASLPTEFGGLAGSGVVLPIAPRFNLTILLDEKTVRLVNSQLNVRTGGYVTIKGSLPKAEPVLPPTLFRPTSVPSTPPPSAADSLNINGRLILAEGILTLPTARFKILPPGILSLNYPVYDAGQPSFSLNVDTLRAQTSLTATSLGGVRKRYKVTVNVSGPLSGSSGNLFATRSGLKLMFATDPDDLALGQAALTQRLAGALIGVDNINQFGQNPGQAFASVLTNVLTSSYLPGAFDRIAAATGFEQIELGYDPVQRLTLSLSRHLYGPLYISYFRTLQGAQEKYDLKLSFRFRERYQLSYDLDEQHTSRYLLEGVWRF
jgi:autotransporter translocation and assembly factor TamB